MPLRVLVVDDSGFFRRRVKEMIGSDSRLEVIGEAVNGQEAVDLAASLNPDVITMDIEMPVMDGITAVRRIMARRPIPILMFSSLTTDGAKATLDALEAGAVDYLPKKFEDISLDRDTAKRELCERVYTVAARRSKAPPVTPAAPRRSTPGASRTTPETARRAPQRPMAAPSRATISAAQRGRFKLLAIGTSTGGPVALQEVLTKLPMGFSLPIILIQHMPGSFTPAFAQRLDGICAITVKEARDGDELKPGVALLAPGGKQMEVDVRAGRGVVRVFESPPEYNYKPSVDLAFESVAKCYPRNTLAIVLTGMGADGREGARKLKHGGSMIWAQDEASCVVYGMPAAIVDAGLSDQVLPLKSIGDAIVQQV